MFAGPSMACDLLLLPVPSVFLCAPMKQLTTGIMQQLLLISHYTPYGIVSLMLYSLPLHVSRWVCKMVKKKFKSTVLCCAFHPSNGQLLATGCADFKCRVFSTFATDVDGTAVNPGPFSTGVGPMEFGEAYTELSALGWVHAVAWSPSGDVLAYTGHDSSVHFADLTTTRADVEPVVRTVRLSQLPLCSLLFIGEHALVGAGHDFNPTLFTYSGTGTWSFFGYIDKQEPAQAVTATSGVSAARELFKNKTVRGEVALLPR